MIKADLVQAVASNLGLDRVVVKAVLDDAMSEVRKAIAKKDSVYLRGFGTFSAKLRKEKRGQNISAKETVIIPEHYVPHFKPCPDFKEQVAE
ncbi:MAG: HU family DNA-binding protein [Paludibacteraceae bacterium]|nr:HU family DNA-binding protein [Paludibacteraceae bacterium]